MDHVDDLLEVTKEAYKSWPEKYRPVVDDFKFAADIDQMNRFDGDFYINDGSRTIRHETAFQDYLEKYFGFRKAYCKLNIIYKKDLGH